MENLKDSDNEDKEAGGDDDEEDDEDVYGGARVKKPRHVADDDDEEDAEVIDANDADALDNIRLGQKRQREEKNEIEDRRKLKRQKR